MHDLKWWFGVVSGVLSLGAYIPLIIAWKRGWRPHRATWSIWVFVTGTIAASMIAGGAWETAFIPAGYCVGASIIAVLSFKQGVGGWSVLDRWCIGVAGIGMTFWVITGNPIIALVLSMVADCSAGIPTAYKLLGDPKSEDSLGWSLFLLGSFVGIFATREWTFSQAGYPIFLSVFNGVIVALILRKPKPVSVR